MDKPDLLESPVTQPEAAPGAAVVPTLIINLEKDGDRRKAILAQFAGLPGVEPRIVDGVYGRSLPDSLCEALAQDERWARNKGTIGCFLSHMKAWEEVARLTVPFALVLEDDVNVAGLRRLASLALPEDAEIVFVNDRMSPLENRDVRTALPIWRALQCLDSAHSGPGGDGYLLAPAGARKLIAACAKDLCFGHVDGRLLRYAATEADLAKLPEKSWVVGVVRHHRHPTLIPTLGLLKGYCLSTPLVKHLGVPSIREAEDGEVASVPAAPRSSGAASAFAARGTGGLPIRYWNLVRNAGDQVNPYLFEVVAGRTPYFSARRNQPHVLGVGSILFMATPESHVWGSGILAPDGDYSQVSPDKVHAVRGKLTRDILRSKYGLDRDVPLGDPGVFADEIPEVVEYTRSSRIKRRIGVIPHHRMIDHPYIRDITRRADACVIDPHLDCIDFIREIVSSEIILSQSLHGLIFAQVFRKPYAWFSHTHDEAWLFKFRDWFSTTTAPASAPAMFGTSLENLLQAARLPGLAIDKAALRAAMPQLPAGDRQPGIGFRETRRLAPLTFRVTPDAGAPSAIGYDATIACPAHDEDCLQKALHAHARRYDDSFNLWLVFDPAVFAGLTVGDMQRYSALLDELPDVHYLSILPSRLKVPGQDRLPVQIGGRPEPVEKRHPSYDWQGAVLVRSPFEFSFSARGLALFKEVGDGTAARAA
jgi:GR25 family glycosyltransferase involved in LPS biosynthesis